MNMRKEELGNREMRRRKEEIKEEVKEEKWTKGSSRYNMEWRPEEWMREKK